MILALSLIIPMMNKAQAQDSVCAQVKIIIEQKLSLERQAFDAKMVINTHELGIAGVAVTLTGTELRTQNRIDVTVYSQKDGSYVFKFLEAGTYTITTETVAGMTDAGAVAGTSGGTVSVNQITKIKLDSDFQADGYVFSKVAN